MYVLNIHVLYNIKHFVFIMNIIYILSLTLNIFCLYNYLFILTF